MSERQKRIRQELIKEENKLLGLVRHLQAGVDGLTEYYAVREAQVHHGMRRKFFLKDLLKVQIKEFDRES